MSMILYLRVRPDCPNRSEVVEFYKSRPNHPTDSGVDLFFPQDFEFEKDKVTKCGLGIECKMVKRKTAGSIGHYLPTGFGLYGRSSISKTPLQLANNVGIIDSTYRGEIICMIRAFDNFHVKKSERLVQIVAPNFKPITVILVDELDKTERGSGGFGSTN